MLQSALPYTPHSVDFDFYSKRPDLWAIAASLRHAQPYRQAIWALLSREDQEALRAHKLLYQTALEAYREASKPTKR